MRLIQLETGKTGTVRALQGKPHSLSRVISMGFTPGTVVQVIQNYKSLPLLVYFKDTLVAIDRLEAKGIVINDI